MFSKAAPSPFNISTLFISVTPEKIRFIKPIVSYNEIFDNNAKSQTSVFLCADKHIKIGFLIAIDIVSHFPLHK